MLFLGKHLVFSIFNFYFNLCASSMVTLVQNFINKTAKQNLTTKLEQLCDYARQNISLEHKISLSFLRNQAFFFTAGT